MECIPAAAASGGGGGGGGQLGPASAGSQLRGPSASAHRRAIEDVFQSVTMMAPSRCHLRLRLRLRRRVTTAPPAPSLARVARRLLTVRGHFCPASGRAEHALVSLLFVGHRRLSSAVLLLRVDCTRTALRCTPLHPAAPRSALPLHLPCPMAPRQRCEGHP